MLSKNLNDYASDVSYYLLGNFKDELAENDVDTIIQEISENDFNNPKFDALWDVFDGQLSWSYIIIYLMLYFRAAAHREINLGRIVRLAGHKIECYLNFSPMGSVRNYGLRNSNLAAEIDKLNFIIKKENLKGCDSLSIYSSDGVSEVYLSEDLKICLCVLCPNLKHVELSSTVETISFYNCPKLEKIVLPRSIKTIAGECFSLCTSLDTIIYEGTKSEWKQIEKGWHWKHDSKITEIKCSDGVIKLI